MLPPDSGCSWTGLSMIGGQHVWLTGHANDIYLFQHELGHNLGMDHANEGADVMGWGYVTFNAPHIVQMGWLNAFSGKVIDVTSSQTLSLETLETDPLRVFLPKIIRIKPPAAPTPTPTPTPTADRTAPTVSITSPVDGTRVNRKSIVTATANASDNVGVSRVDLYVNGTRYCSDSSAPYSCSWRVGRYSGVTYKIQAIAYDAAGNSTASAPVSVTSY